MTMSTQPIPGGIPTFELEIGGMTCASCANRIEKKLNKLDGVSATVNYATEKAKVTVPDGYDPALLIAEVEKTLKAHNKRLILQPLPLKLDVYEEYASRAPDARAKALYDDFLSGLRAQRKRCRPRRPSKAWARWVHPSTRERWASF